MAREGEELDRASVMPAGERDMIERSILVLAALTVLAPASAETGSADRRAQARAEVLMGTMPQEFIMAKITVSDLNRSYAFYTDVVGLKAVSSPDIPISKLPKPDEPPKAFIEIPLNFTGSMADPMMLLALRRGVQPTREGAGLTWIGLKVPSTAAVVDRAAEHGIKPSRPFSGDGAVAFLTDPDGYQVELIQTASYNRP
jgi:catechol 2,3-dioxygenase-like lactoylglutathione lyase family enzyme